MNTPQNQNVSEVTEVEQAPSSIGGGVKRLRNISIYAWTTVVCLIISIVGVRLITFSLDAIGLIGAGTAIDIIAIAFLGFAVIWPDILYSLTAVFGFIAAKESKKEIEDIFTGTYGKIFSIILGAGVWMFVLPDAVLMMVGQNISFEVILRLATLGAFVGIMLGYAGVPAKSTIRIIAGIAAAVVVHNIVWLVKFSEGSISTDIQKNWNVIVEKWWIMDIIIFSLIAFENPFETPKSWLKAFWSWLGFWKSVGIIIVLTVIWLAHYDNAMGSLIRGMDGFLNRSSTALEESRQSPTTSLGKILSSPDPIEKVFRLKSLEGGKLCGLPKGKHKITAQQTQLYLASKMDGSAITIESILGGSGVLNIAELPYQETNDYHWGILFNNKRSGSEIAIPDNGCINITFNVSQSQKDAILMAKQTNISITVR